MSRLTDLSQFDFESPLLVYRNVLEAPDRDRWKSGVRWIESLAKSEFGELKGIVLPLELKETNRQRLHGVDLLNWVRWSGTEAIRYVPVLAVAWQSLAQIMRKKSNRLLIAEGTRFLRLPEAAENGRKAVSEFVAAVRAEPPEAQACDKKVLEKYASTGSEEVARLTHHDLANDYYAAVRLWRGYVRALQDVADKVKKEDRKAIADELKIAQAVKWNWEAEILAKKLQQPWFKQYQMASSRFQLPAYGLPEYPEKILSQHVRDGLPKNVRILLVDDEFEKGMADVLLRILFKADEFTRKSADRTERVYSETVGPTAEPRPRARLVCVKNAESARHWLTKWREMPLGEDRSSQARFSSWYETWAKELGWRQFPPPITDPETQTPVRLAQKALAAPPGMAKPLDDYPPERSRMTTVVLLDLRLEKEEAKGLYFVKEFSSVKLRDEIKAEKPDLPVIIFTASRQGINYAEVMEEPGDFDGWLWKEGPDILVDDDDPRRLEQAKHDPRLRFSNSSRCVIRLLSHLHFSAVAGEWYNPSWKWNKEDMQSYAEFWGDEEREQLLQFVSGKATELFGKLVTGEFGKEMSSGYLAFIQKSTGEVPYRRVIPILIARCIYVAALLLTAKWTGNEVEDWDVDPFARKLRGDAFVKGFIHDHKEDPKYPDGNPRYPNDVMNHRHLWLKSYKHEEICALLLPQEVQWLTQMDWPAERKEAITRWTLRKGRTSPVDQGQATKAGRKPETGGKSKRVQRRRANREKSAKESATDSHRPHGSIAPGAKRR